ncbi:MAG TPA: glycosyltransferase [Patescibacteria group bacterium]|jgi:glycosyltransferase involved in cell wall biosynthesis|nr:glycosyltransferase [Patescibacteria group bacterium]
MRIGLFTDTYRPSINGIVFVVETLKKRLEEEGHEVFIFCPAKSIRRSSDLEFEDNHIVRFPSIKGAFFDDYDTSIFFPRRVVQQIKDLELDVIHIFTPSQVGLVGVQAAWKNDTPFVMQHSTDLYEFVEHYPVVLPGVLALIGIVLPFTVRLGGQDVREILKLYRPRRGVTQWNQDIIERAITILYSKADAVIALCRKSVDQLCSWQHHENYRYDVTLMPNGVDALPKPSSAELKSFKNRFGIEAHDEVYGFVGRLAAEKNLDMLIDAAEKIIKTRPNAKLMFVGDFEYRETLEEKAAMSKAADNIIFTGAYPREQLGVVYAAMDVFVFPSLKDTQGWVLHEAAHAGLPIVLIDQKLSEVALEHENALFAKNNATDMARKILMLLDDDEMRREYGKQSKRLAKNFSERRQIKSLIQLYDDIVESHIPRPESRSRLRLRRRDKEVNAD